MHVHDYSNNEQIIQQAKNINWIQSSVSVSTLKKKALVIISDVVCSVWLINLLFTSHAHLHFVVSDERIRQTALTKTLAYQQYEEKIIELESQKHKYILVCIYSNSVFICMLIYKSLLFNIRSLSKIPPITTQKKKFPWLC